MWPGMPVNWPARAAECTSTINKEFTILLADNGGPKGWARLNKTLTRHKSVLIAFKQKTATQRNAQQISGVSMLHHQKCK